MLQSPLHRQPADEDGQHDEANDAGGRPIGAAVQAADILMAPVEKLSMAGTRPNARRPKTVTGVALALGSNTPTYF